MMADKIKEGGRTGPAAHEDTHAILAADEGHSLDVTDDFDPFGVFECIDVGVDNALAAPPQDRYHKT